MFFISVIPLVRLHKTVPVKLNVNLPVLPACLIYIINGVVPIPFVCLFTHGFLV